jgi:hypothetical protein
VVPLQQDQLPDAEGDWRRPPVRSTRGALRASAQLGDLEKLEWSGSVAGVMSQRFGEVGGSGQAVQADREVTC